MKQLVIKFLLRHVVKVTITDDIVREHGGKLYLGTKLVTPTELKSITSEAKALENMRLWSILTETMKQRIYEKGWQNSTTLEHLNIAKAEFSILDIQESIIRIFKNYKLP